MKSLFEFENFRVDQEKRLLWKDGSLTSIKPKTFETLLVLLKNKNKTIGKDELIEEIWQGEAISDDSLTQQISKLRKILGETADEHKFILTVPGVGYKFVANVREIPLPKESGENSKSQILQAGGNHSEFREGDLTRIDNYKSQEHQERGKKNTFNPKRTWLIAIVAFSIFGMAAIFAWTNNNKPAKTNALGIKKIAVLPFRATAETDEIQALKNGMTDSLVTRLSRIDELNVLPSALVSEYKNSEQSPLKFGSQVEADAVLDGIVRKNGEQIIVNVQLFDVKDGKVLWSDTFQSEFTDILEVQSLITYKIAEALKLELSDEEERALMKQYTTSAEAYRLFLDATYIQNLRKNKEARILAESYYERAIKLDPHFAMAYVELANLQLHSPSPKAYQKMKMLAEQAIKIDPELSQAYGVYAFAVWRGEWNWKDAEAYLKKAVNMSPRDFGSHGTYSMILAGQGKFDEALNVNFADQSQSDANVSYQIAIYFFKRDIERAIELCLQKLEKNPRDITALSYLAPAYCYKGIHSEAIKTAEKYAALDETADVGSLVYLSLAYIKAGQIEKGREVLQGILKKDAPDSAQKHGALAMLYGELGEKDKAFEHLEKSVENREWWAFTLKVAPYWDTLRGDRRFNEILRRINLAE